VDITPDGDGEVVVTVADGAAQGASGLDCVGDSLSIVSLRTPPTATVSTTDVSPTAAAVIPVTIAFDQDVTGFTIEDIAVTNGAAANFHETGRGSEYAVDVTPDGDGEVAVTVADGAAQGASGLDCVGDSLSVVSLRTAPTATLTTTEIPPTAAATIPVTIAFDQDVIGFAIEDIAVTNGTAGNFHETGRGSEYAVDVTPDGDGEVAVTVADGAAQGASGLDCVGDSVTIVSLRTAPTATVTTTEISPTAAATIPVTIAFDQDVIGFTIEDIAVTNGTAGNFHETGRGSEYAVDVTPDGDGEVVVAVADGAAQGASGLDCVGDSLSIVSLRTPPTATVSTTEVSPTAAAVIPVTIAFDQDVTGFTLEDVAVTNGTAGNFHETGRGSEYAVDVTPDGDGEVFVTVADGAAQGASGLDCVGDSLSVVSLRTAPTATVTTTEISPTAAATIPVTIAFDQDVTGFAVEDIAVTNGTAGNFHEMGRGSEYAVDITPDGDGEVVVTVADGAAQGASGLDCVGDSLSIVSLRTPPTATLTTTVPSPTSAATIPVTIAFDQDVTGFTIEDIAVTNGAAGNFHETGRGSEYAVDITPDGDGEVVVTVADGAAQGASGLDCVGDSLSVVSLRTPPTATLTTTVPSPTSAATIPVIVAFDLAVNGFTVEDIAVTNGTAGNFHETGRGSEYAVDVTPDGDGEVAVTVADGAAQGASGLDCVGDSLSVVSLRTPPTATLTTTVPSPTSAATIPVMIAFDQDVTGLAVEDIAVTNGTAGNFHETGRGSEYAVDVTPDGDGEVVVTVADGAAQGDSGLDCVGDSLSVISLRTAPTATISTTESSPTAAAIIPVTIAFDLDVIGFTVEDIAVTNGTAGNFHETGRGSEYAVDITPDGDGELVVAVADGAAQGASGLDCVGDSLSVVSLRTAPTATLTTTEVSPTAAATIPVTIAFDQDVTGFAVEDIAVTNGTAGNFHETGRGSEYAVDVTPEGDGELVVAVADGAAQGASGLDCVGDSLSVISLRTAPTATLTTTVPSPTSAATIPVMIAFDQDVIGFTIEDIAVTNGAAGNFHETGRGSEYAVDITPDGDGEVVVTVADGAAQGASGLDCVGDSLSVVSLRTAPTATLTTTVPSPTSAATIPVTIAFDQDVTGFAVEDIAVTNGTAGNFHETGRGSEYAVDVTPEGDGELAVTVADGAAQGASGLDCVGDSLSVVSLRTAPTATLTTTVPSPTSAATIPVTIAFDQDVTGFAVEDIAVTNGTAGNFHETGRGSEYAVDVTPDGDGEVVVAVADGAAQGASGLDCVGDSLSVEVRTELPAVIADQVDLDTMDITFNDVVDDPLNPANYVFSPALEVFSVERIGGTYRLTTGRQAAGITYQLHYVSPGGTAFESDVASAGFTAVFQDGLGGGVYLGEAEGASDGFDEGFDEAADDQPGASVSMHILNGATSSEGVPLLGGDIRESTGLNRWYLEMELTGISDTGIVSWDLSGLDPSKVVFLQPMDGESPAGPAIDMLSTTELTVSASGIYQITVGYPEEVQLALNEGWNLIGTPLIGTTPLGEMTSREGSRESMIVGAAWQWRSGEYKLARTDAPLCAEQGYWVYASSSGVCRPAAGLREQELLNPSPGWNLVSPSATCTGAELGIGDAPVWGWDSASGCYVPVVPGTQLSPGLGYWVYIGTSAGSGKRSAAIPLR
jgi:uncharacterized lipoprotein YbaY